MQCWHKERLTSCKVARKRQGKSCPGSVFQFCKYVELTQVSGQRGGHVTCAAQQKPYCASATVLHLLVQPLGHLGV